MTDFIEDFERYDALGLADLVRRKEVKPIELVETVIHRIEQVNPTLNCVNIKTYDLARKMAGEMTSDGLFAGVPLLMKDLLLFWGGVKLTNASMYFKDFVAPDDSVVVQRLKQAGFILVGKTATPEQGLSASTESRLWGQTHNPWSLEHVAGGSSGGSAAAVAARILPLADANDGGGSIRIPASNNGIVGLKPSRGRVTLAPHYGDLWFGGAICNCVSLTVRDTAAYLDVIAGSVPGDPYQLPRPDRPFLDEVSTDPGRLKIGLVTKSPVGLPVAPACVAAVEEAAQKCAALGHEVVQTEFTFDLNPLWEIFLRLAMGLAVAGLQTAEMLIGRPPTEDDFERATWDGIQMGRTITGAQFAADYEVLRHYGRQIAMDCEPFDIILTPTQPEPPAKLGAYDQDKHSLEELTKTMIPAVCFTLPFNASGQPAMSLPLHWSDDTLPLGVQLVGRYAQEATILRLAGQLEKSQPWIGRKPPVCA